MKKLIALLRSLKAQGFISKAQKAELATMLKEVSEETAEAVAEDVAEVEALPEKEPEAPKADEGAKEEEAKAFISKLFGETKSDISKDLDKAVKGMKADLEVFAKKELSARRVSSPTLSIDKAQYDVFAKSVKSGKKADLTIDLKGFDMSKVKVAGDISIDGNITGELPQAQLDPMVSRDPQRSPFVQDLISVGTISSNLDAWIETTGEDGDPLPVSELAKLPAKDYDFAKRTAEVKKIGVYSKYSREMADDLPNLVSEIKNFLIMDLKRVVDTQLLNGSGEYDEIIGILKNAVAYSAGSFAGTISRANRFDVIETAVSQVVTALHTPNIVVLHPTDVAKMNLTKDVNGQYVLPPFMTASGQTISGVRVVSNTGITVGKFLVGDFTKDTCKYQTGISLEMTNTDQDDFVKDRFTVKATVRLVNRVRENDYEAFVYGDFTSAIASLESGS